MVLRERVVSPFFLIIVTINGMHSTSRSRDNSLGILSDFISKDSRSPLVVVIRSAQDAAALDNEITKSSNQDYSATILESSSDDNHISAKLESVNAIYDTMIRNQNDDNKMLRTKTVVNKLEQEQMILHALRSRCQAKIECTLLCTEEKPKKDECSESSVTCSESLEKCTEEDSCDEKKKEPEKYCPKSCKAIFDHLLNCPPPGNDRKKDRYKNRSTRAYGPPTGRTLPPNWKH